jgi:carbon starvation protein
MFGTANQLLATIALAVGTTYLINQGKKRYAWTTLLPMSFVGVTTIYAGALNIINLYIPQLSDPSTITSGIINLALTGVILISVVVIIADALPIWIRAFKDKTPPKRNDEVKEAAQSI